MSSSALAIAVSLGGALAQEEPVEVTTVAEDTDDDDVVLSTPPVSTTKELSNAAVADSAVAEALADVVEGPEEGIIERVGVVVGLELVVGAWDVVGPELGLVLLVG